MVQDSSFKDSWHAELGWLDGYTYGILREEWVALSPVEVVATDRPRL